MNNLVRQDLLEGLSTHAGLFQFGPDLIGRFSLHQSFRLGQEVGQQDFVVESALNIREITIELSTVFNKSPD